jgi:CheY-like chemotaxis protein
VSELSLRLPQIEAAARSAPTGPAHYGDVFVKRILVADDQRDQAEGLSALFDAMGYETAVAYDGQQAVEVASDFQPHVVFLDLDMPRMNGYDAAMSMRQDASLSHAFLIALTASHGRSVEVATKAAGFNSYVQKPADTYALIAIVSDVANLDSRF